MSPAQAAKAPTVEVVPFTNSGFLTHGEYDSQAMRLQLGFRYGGVRQYWPVYPQTWLDFKLSPSKGRYFHEAIRPIFGEGMKIV